MSRTKWMRLTVGDLADVVRWAGEQQARQISEFRYRVINGRESVSFRMVPDYGIQVGTRDIVVVCHVRQGLLSRMGRLARGQLAAAGASLRQVLARLADLKTRPKSAALQRSAEVHPFPLARRLG